MLPTNDSLLLPSPLAQELYHRFAAAAPIFDFHSHLSAAEIAANRRYENLAQIWIAPDPYKHRAMRMAGVPERFITGSASDREKFQQWAKIMPAIAGSPAAQWTALELTRGLGIAEALDEGSSSAIWTQAQALLAGSEYAAQGILRRANVAAIVTSDRLLDDLAGHEAAQAAGIPTAIRPSVRADDALAVESADFPAWVRRLGERVGAPVTDLDGFLDALIRRFDHFARLGCRLGDLACEEIPAGPVMRDEAARLFRRRLADGSLPVSDGVRLKSAILTLLAREHARRGWTLQLHVGARRGIGRRLQCLVGAAAGCAGIGPPCDLSSLCDLFDHLDEDGALPQMIVYPLNPADFSPVAVLSGTYSEDDVAGKIRLGAAWWYNDHREGIRAQLAATANFSLLSQMPGMVMDARSILSTSRHDYFRRILCSWLAEQAAAGTLTREVGALASLIKSILETNPCRLIGL
ncbi:MAG TPA: glucuronate isomerase [Opitutaceae bacterium]|jgi:glucuronate isomerase|nr:glucuronate isomerase [Opitutaceae bacterium]